ncbi:YabP/YqfC family sporulation protein [Thermoactinomyces sp. DSM 45892]|uniref:YabP/YqfC family sporulation protein n=1 Tax=Thermoactinomyces sp. DSM 45892 TaxID=1882753 RepID=UPI00089A9297|nr:YabP/YqfC family sporulation protein [Thermoactinomyces sp. DSM 45892]SDY67059.1 sporulation protein YqfC [Thermoactinomyces sp. DSM 45892]
MKKRWNGHMRDWASKWLDLPPDVASEVPRIEWIGNDRLRVENYKKIEELTEKSISLSTILGFLDIQGSRIVVKVIDSEVVIVEGEIKDVRYRK